MDELNTEEIMPIQDSGSGAPETPKKKKKDKVKTVIDGDPSKTTTSGDDDPTERAAEKEKKEKKKKKKDKRADKAESPERAIDSSADVSLEDSPKKSKKEPKDKSRKSPKSKKKDSVSCDSSPEREARKAEKKEKKKKKKDKAKEGAAEEAEDAMNESLESVDADESTSPVSEKTMKAWQLAAYNPDVHAAVDSLTLVEIRVPSLSDGNQVLIKVNYAAINPIDYKLFTGGFHNACPIENFPYTPGFDVAGSVAAVGDSVKRIKVGDKVIADIGLLESCKKPALKQGSAGAFAEYAIVPEQLIVVCNNVDDLKTVAGLPLVGLTVYQALFTGNNRSLGTGNPLGSLQKDEKLLILGGSSATGSVAIQMAKAKGAFVATTASSTSRINDGSMSKVEFCKNLGADVVIDYTVQDWSEELKEQEFDMILDCVGQADEPAKAGKVLKQGGLFVSIANFTMDGKCDGIRYEGMLLRSNAEDLQNIYGMVERGELKIPIDSLFQFKDLQQAMDRQTSGKASGKVILAVANE